MENTKKQTTMDSIWQELTCIVPPQPELKLVSGKIDDPVSFWGTKKTICIRRHHPMEHLVRHNEPDITMEDWTRPHD